MARQHEIVARLRPPREKLERTGARLYFGEARFLDLHTLRVDGAEVRGDRVIIAAGSAPIVPPIPGRGLAITSDELLFLPECPRRLVLVGAGAIGLEMASAFSDLGADVTVIGQEDEILPTFDPDVAAYLRAMLETGGVQFHRRTQVTELSGRPGDVLVNYVVAGAASAAQAVGGQPEARGAPSADRTLRADVVCLAVGRRWDPRSLGAETLGFQTNRIGLQTSPTLRTSVPHVYAAGDAAGNSQLTPTAAHEGRVAGGNTVQGDHAVADLSVVPQAILTTPEIARVGLTHQEARARGMACHIATHDLRGASNGVATGEDGGYLKLVFEEGSERVVGVQMVSYVAAELIQLAALAVRAGATADMLSTQLSIHPSHAERLIKVAAHEFHEVCEL